MQKESQGNIMENNQEEYPVPQDYTYILNDMDKLRQEMAANKSWTLTVEADPDNPEDMILTFPDDLMESTGWQSGDVIEWKDNQDGTWTLIKKQK